MDDMLALPWKICARSVTGSGVARKALTAAPAYQNLPSLRPQARQTLHNAQRPYPATSALHNAP